MSTASFKLTLWKILLIGSAIFLFEIGSVNAQVQQSVGSRETPAPANNQNPEDPALTNWKAKDKYFLTVAATKTAGEDTDLPYAKVDGNKVSGVLLGLGYKKLDTLTDKTATRENFIERLKLIRNLKENGLVVVYYSGHGAIDPEGKDLWLQLYGQKYYGESQGLSVSELIRIARAGSYKGELVLILDACYSGQGAWTKGLNLSDVENTLIFASSSRTQESFPVDVSSSETMSAFTHYLLKGLTEDWDIVDERRQGILLYEDLRTYIEVRLTQLLVNANQPSKEMMPDISGNPGKIWAAFDPTKAQNLQSLLRQAIGFRGYLKNQLPNLLNQGQLQSLTPPSVSTRARELAELVPDNADPYTRALKAIAEGKNTEALRLLDEAERTRAAELVDIYQARGDAMIYKGNFVEGKNWYEKALRVNQRENPELLEEASMVFAIVSDFGRAEALLRQALEIRERTSKGAASIGADLMGLSMLQFFQGRFKEAESYLQRVQTIDPKILEAEERGASLLPRFMMILIKLMQEEVSEAERLAKEFEAIPESELPAGDPVRLIARFILFVVYSESGKTIALTSLASQFLEMWEQAINEGDVERLSFYMGFAVGMSTGVSKILGEGSELARRYELITKRSLEFIRRHSGPSSPELAMSLYTVAIANSIARRHAEAESLLLEAIAISEKTLGKNNALIGLMYAAIGAVYSDARRYREAEIALQKSLTIAESTTGTVSMFAMIAVEGLAKLHERQGKYDEAVGQYERLIQISTRIWRDGGGIVANDIEKVASIKQRQKRYSEAEKLYKQALSANEKRWGPQHQESLTTLINLGSLYFDQHKYKEAETLFLKAVTLGEANRKLEPEIMANSLLWLSEVYLIQKQLAEADKIAKKFNVLAGKLSEGEEKDSVVRMLMEIARYYGEQRKDSDAKRLYDQVLAIYENEAANLRPVVAVHIYVIAQYFGAHGAQQQAERLFQRAIVIDEQTLGKDNLEVAIDLEALAELYRLTNRYDEGISLYLRSISIREKVGDGVALAMSRRRLGFLFLLSHKYSEARSSLEKAVQYWESASAPNQLELADCLVYLAIVEYQTTQDYVKAETLLRRAISIEERNPQDPNLGEDLRLLANVYRFQRKYGESEKTLKRSRAVIGKTPGRNSAIAKILFNLVLVYKAEGKLAAANAALHEALNGKYTGIERADLIAWLEYYAAALRYMKRDNEAIELSAWAQQLRQDVQPNPQSRDESESYGRIERVNPIPLEIVPRASISLEHYR